MKPIVKNVTEQNVLLSNGQIGKAVILTYTVGAYGPFTLTTNEAELQSQVAQQKMNAFAATLNALPTS